MTDEPPTSSPAPAADCPYVDMVDDPAAHPDAVCVFGCRNEPACIIAAGRPASLADRIQPPTSGGQ